MKFLTTIEARFDSTRLPGKVIYPLSSTKTVLDILIHRIKKSKNVNKIILATSKNKNNHKIIKVAKKNKIFLFQYLKIEYNLRASTYFFYYNQPQMMFRNV